MLSALLVLCSVALLIYSAARSDEVKDYDEPLTKLTRPLANNRTSSHHGMNPAYFGLVKLPVDLDPNLLPAACTNFDVECALEAAQQYEVAFAGYETRLAACGLAGWKKIGNLGSGNEVTTMLLETPCGLRTAVKAYQSKSANSHIANDCLILKELLPEYERPYCRGCIPKYYYHSNATGACYEEHIYGLPARNTLAALKPALNSQGGRGALFRLFSQGIGALRALQQHGVIHRDLVLPNMLVRLPVKEEPTSHLQLIFLDFGWAVSNTIQKRKNDQHDQKRNSHADAYALACEFYTFLSYGKCAEAAADEVAEGNNPAQFKSLLRSMLIAGVSPSASSTLDFVTFRTRMAQVTQV